VPVAALPAGRGPARGGSAGDHVAPSPGQHLRCDRRRGGVSRPGKGNISGRRGVTIELTLQRILWPTDFSALSLRAVRYARALGARFGAQLHVIHVVPPQLSSDVSLLIPAEVPVAAAEPELISAAQAALEKLVAEHLAGCAGVVTKVLFGNPWPSICGYAKDNAIDLIIITTHGRTGLGHVLIGSTAERIVQHAPCPVLTIRRTARDFVHPPEQAT